MAGDIRCKLFPGVIAPRPSILDCICPARCGGLLGSANFLQLGLGFVPQVHADVGADSGVHLGEFVTHAVRFSR